MSLKKMAAETAAGINKQVVPEKIYFYREYPAMAWYNVWEAHWPEKRTREAHRASRVCYLFFLHMHGPIHTGTHTR